MQDPDVVTLSLGLWDLAGQFDHGGNWTECESTEWNSSGQWEQFMKDGDNVLLNISKMFPHARLYFRSLPSPNQKALDHDFLRSYDKTKRNGGCKKSGFFFDHPEKAPALWRNGCCKRSSWFNTCTALPFYAASKILSRGRFNFVDFYAMSLGQETNDGIHYKSIFLSYFDAVMKNYCASIHHVDS